MSGAASQFYNFCLKTNKKSKLVGYWGTKREGRFLYTKSWEIMHHLLSQSSRESSITRQETGQLTKKRFSARFLSFDRESFQFISMFKSKDNSINLVLGKGIEMTMEFSMCSSHPLLHQPKALPFTSPFFLISSLIICFEYIFYFTKIDYIISEWDTYFLLVPKMFS
jgi:hypothetical protein